MKYSVSCAQMKAIDRFTIEEIGIPSLVLMERAALEIANRVINQYEKKKIGIVCGTGNNGGDGIAIGRILFLKRFDVELYLAGDFDKASDQTKTQLSIARKLNIPITHTFPEVFEDNTILVDAIFGIGLDREIDSAYESIITSINNSHATILSVDIPSGLSAEEGIPLKSAVKADKTYTIGFHKKGFMNPKAQEFIGELEVMDIGYPPYRFIKQMMESEETDE